MLDTSWNNNRRSLYGLAIGVIFVVASRYLIPRGILEIGIFFAGFYVGYELTGGKKRSER